MLLNIEMDDFLCYFFLIFLYFILKLGMSKIQNLQMKHNKYVQNPPRRIKQSNNSVYTLN
jgi:hypothetical protein